MHYDYKTRGTCSQMIHLDINDGVVTNVSFDGGCNGNLKAVSTLVEGSTAEEIVAKLSGIRCGRRPTSCGDQLAHAVAEAALAEQQAKG